MDGIRAIFFDIGDTLVYDDPPLTDRVRRSLDACGLAHRPDDLTPAFRVAENYAMNQYLRGVPFDDPDVLATSSVLILRELGIGPLGRDQHARLSETFVACGFRRVLHERAIPLLTELGSRGFRLGAISDWEPTLPNLLQDLGVARHFDAVAVSAIVGVTKPNPELFRAALDHIAASDYIAARAPLTPEQSIHIGDYYELDVAGARAAGMHALLFDWKQRTPHADCDRVTSFDQLAEKLLALPAPND